MQTELFLQPPSEGPIGTIELWAQETGFELVMGVDEAGRGPLAGPVVAGAAVLPSPLPLTLVDLDDSKRLKEATRERLFDAIMSDALAVGIGIVDASTIDDINILEATRLAMTRAIEDAQRHLDGRTDVLFVDGHLPLPKYRHRQWPLVKGDSRSWSVAAGSILAKVTRDRMMADFDTVYPEYGFSRHKGYGTIEHRRALHKHGPCPVHRQTFKWNPPK